MKGKKTKGALALHNLCELFPPMSDPDIAELAEDIKKNGQRHPIKLYEGKVLDGRNRYLACKLAGVTPLTEQFTEGDAMAFVLSENMHRRHLDASQRAMIGAAAANLKQGQTSKASTEATQDQVASIMKVSRSSIQRAKKVQKNAAKSVQKLVREGTVSLAKAEKISTLPKKRQREISRGGAEAVNKAAKPRARGGLAAAVFEETRIERNEPDSAEHRQAARGDMDDPLDADRKPIEDGSTMAPVTNSETAIARLQNVYAIEKDWFNSLPPKSPRQIVDKLIEALK